jgi:hypothetical protein
LNSGIPVLAPAAHARTGRKHFISPKKLRRKIIFEYIIVNAEQRQEILIKAEEARQAARYQMLLWGEAKRKFVQLEKELSPRIDELTREADALAAKFRTLYGESQGEFTFKNHDVAKELAEKGHEIEVRCTALNREANSLRHILEESYKEYKMREYEDRRLMRKARDYESKLWTKRRDTNITNFDESAMGDDWNVKKFLDTFPQGIFGRIDSIDYHTDWYKGVEGMRGWTNLYQGVLHATIDIFPHKDKMHLRQTLAREIGHVVFQECISKEERSLWTALYEVMAAKGQGAISPYALEGAEQDFCECFSFFKTKPYQLEQFDENVYHFIKIIHDALPDEKDEDP